jgi:hypothetical protein
LQKENRKKEKIDMKLFQQSRAFYGGKPALLAQQSLLRRPGLGWVFCYAKGFAP